MRTIHLTIHFEQCLVVGAMASATTALVFMAGGFTSPPRAAPLFTSATQTTPAAVVSRAPFVLDAVVSRRSHRLVVSVGERDVVAEACWARVHRGVQFHRSTPGDVYPPYPKNMRLWRALREDASSHFYVRCDADAVVNGTNLARVVAALDPSEAVYAGKLGTGRAHERAALGLGTAAFPNFVMGGMCEIVSHTALRAIDLDVCARLTHAAVGRYARGPITP